MEGGSGAYGSGGASGTGFQIVVFLKKPQVILRIISWVFSIIVFGCITSQAQSDGHCAYGDQSNCGYGTAVGVLAFLGLLMFLVLDALFDNLSNVEHRKYIVIGDIAFSGVWSFLWFVCFCLLTNKWTTSNTKETFMKNKSGIEAAIAFSFFSIGTFIALTILAVIQYRKGVADEFSPEYDPSAFGDSAPYSGTEQNSTPYQASGEFAQSPFTSQDSKPLPSGYQQQTY